MFFPKEAVSILGEDPCRIALNVIGNSIIREKNTNTPGTDCKLSSPSTVIIVRSKHNFKSPPNWKQQHPQITQHPNQKQTPFAFSSSFFTFPRFPPGKKTLPASSKRPYCGEPSDVSLICSQTYSQRSQFCA